MRACAHTVTMRPSSQLERTQEVEQEQGEVVGEKDNSWDVAMSLALAVVYPHDNDVKSEQLRDFSGKARAEEQDKQNSTLSPAFVTLKGEGRVKDREGQSGEVRGGIRSNREWQEGWGIGEEGGGVDEMGGFRYFCLHTRTAAGQLVSTICLT